MVVEEVPPGPRSTAGDTSRSRPAVRSVRRRGSMLIATLLLLAAALLPSLTVGSRSLPTLDVLRALVFPDDSETSVIVRELRLPRTIVAVAVGAALGVAGARCKD